MNTTFVCEGCGKTKPSPHSVEAEYVDGNTYLFCSSDCAAHWTEETIVVDFDETGIGIDVDESVTAVKKRRNARKN